MSIWYSLGEMAQGLEPFFEHSRVFKEHSTVLCLAVTNQVATCHNRATYEPTLQELIETGANTIAGKVQF